MKSILKLLGMARNTRSKRNKTMPIPTRTTKDQDNWKLNVLGSPTDGWFEISLIRGKDNTLIAYGQFGPNKLLISHSGFNSDQIKVEPLVWAGLLSLARQAADVLNGNVVTATEMAKGKLPNQTAGRVMLAYNKLTAEQQLLFRNYLTKVSK